MSFYANLKIRNKLTLGFAIVVIIAFALGIFGYLQIHSLSRAANLLFEKGVKPEEHIGDLAVNFERLRINLRDYIQSKDQIQREYYGERVTKFHAKIESAEKKLGAALPDAESKKLFAQLSKAHIEYHPYFNRILELSKQSKGDEVIAYLKSDSVEAAEGNVIDAIENMQIYLLANCEKISEQNAATATMTGRIMIGLAFGASLLAVIMAILITRSIGNPLRKVLDAVISLQKSTREKAQLVEAIANGDLNQEVIISAPLDIPEDKIGKDETGMLLKAIIGMSSLQHLLDGSFARMTASLRHNHDLEKQYREEEALRDWFKSGQFKLNIILRGDKTTAELTQQALTFLTEYIGAAVGVLYTFDDEDSTLQIAASYAITLSKKKNERIPLSEEGLAGQAARERKILYLDSAPPGYLSINSALGESEPVNILVLPLMYNDALFGILEIGSFKVFSNNDRELLNQSTEGIAIALSASKSRQNINNFL